MISRMASSSLPLLVFVIAGCTAQAPDAAAGTATSAPPARAADAPALKMGEAGRSGAFEIVVSSVKKATEWTRDPPAGHEYIVVAVQVTNISKGEESLGASAFGCVEDDKGNRASWEPTTGIKTDPPTFGAADIAPGGRFAGSLIFAIPVSMSATELHYTVGYALKPALRFQIRK
jgi:hypothetical protein